MSTTPRALQRIYATVEEIQRAQKRSERERERAKELAEKLKARGLEFGKEQ